MHHKQHQKDCQSSTELTKGFYKYILRSTCSSMHEYRQRPSPQFNQCNSMKRTLLPGVNDELCTTGVSFWEQSEGHWTHCPQSIIWTSRYVLRFELNCRKLWRSRRMFEEYQYSTASQTRSADFRLIFRMNLTSDLYASFTMTHPSTCTTQIEAYFHNQ